MLCELQLLNYRGFEKHTMPLRSTTIIVGRNNAGKSTVIEALRLVSVVTERIHNLVLADPDPEACLGASQVGYRPSLKNLEIDFTAIFNRYSEPPAEIKAKFESGESIHIYLYRAKGRRGAAGEGRMHATVRDSHGRSMGSGGLKSRLNLPPVRILPQIGPLAREENRLVPGYVASAMSSSLSSIHFRNQLNLLYDNYFADFKVLAEKNWPGLRIHDLDGRGKMPGPRLTLLVQDADFAGEVAWMGHGLQMWLQTMWFLCRIPASSTVILDEPDVYMHADLQKKLIRLLRGRFKQVILATHSIEIIDEVEPEDILIIDKKQKESSFASTIPAVQRITDNLGSIHNIQLARLWGSRRFLHVEGKDVGLLKCFQDTLFPGNGEPFDIIPQMSVGGWGGWNYAVGSCMMLRNALGDKIVRYCIFDRDYHTDKEIADRIEDARRRGVEVHVWGRKELENYLLVPATVQRCIQQRLTSGKSAPSVSEVRSKMEELAENSRVETQAAVAEGWALINGVKKFHEAMVYARERLEKSWSSFDDKMGIISGKEMLSGLSSWSHAQFGATLSAKLLAKEMRTEEMPDELELVVRTIHLGKDFEHANTMAESPATDETVT